MSAIVHDFVRPSLQLVSALPPRPQPHARHARPLLWIDGDPRMHDVLTAYDRVGGLWSGDEVTRLLRDRTSQPISLLARWIVDSLVISVAWRGDYLLPAFQFDVANATVRRPVFAVLEALGGALKDLDLAAWFALPHADLGDVAPLDLIERETAAVVGAALAENHATRR